MKLYVWENEYRHLAVYAFATNKAEAKKVIEAKCIAIERDPKGVWREQFGGFFGNLRSLAQDRMDKEPRIIEKPEGFVMWNYGKYHYDTTLGV